MKPLFSVNRPDVFPIQITLASVFLFMVVSAATARAGPVLIPTSQTRRLERLRVRLWQVGF